MKRIERSPTKSLAFKVLTWIVYAVRPLQLEEVLHAVAVDELEPEDESVTKDCLTPPSKIVNTCAGMIRIDKESDVVGLVHKTTQEYFDKNGINHFPHAHRDIATGCLRYLSLHVFSSAYCPSNELFERRLKKNALLDYAVRSLGDHISQGFDCSLKDLALKVFLDERITSSASQVLFVDLKQWLMGSQYSQQFRERFQGVHFAAYFGLTDIVKLLIGTGKVDVDSKDSGDQTPLSWAALKGHEAIVKLLLETGKVDVDSKDSWAGRTPLSWAAEKGHEAVVKLLLETGKVAADSKDSDGGRTPLSRAALNGHEAVVRLLLETGKVDVDSKDSWTGQTPLSWAAENGHEAVVRLLLETGKVDVDSKDSWAGRTPLSWAAERGHEAVVRLLLETGKVDVDSKDSTTGRTPLSWAAENGHEAVVRLLQSFIGT
jgi:ankyrin repeat protein